MLTGNVSPHREALVRLTVRGPAGSIDVESVIDTGFTDFLTLPPSVIVAIGARRSGATEVTLADGSQANLNAYRVEVLWAGAYRTVDALEADGIPLTGMSFLYGCNLNMDIVDGGSVAITALG